MTQVLGRIAKEIWNEMNNN